MNGLSDSCNSSSSFNAAYPIRSLQPRDSLCIGENSPVKRQEGSLPKDVLTEAHLKATGLLLAMKPSLTSGQLKGLLAAQGRF